MKAGARHSASYVFVLHELFPYKTGAMVFGHQHGDSEVEAKDVSVVPVRQRIESISEAVLRPNLFAIRPADMTQHSDAILEEKWKRAPGRAGNDTAVHRTERAAIDRGATPRGVPFHVIRSADAPKIFAVIGKTIAERKTEKFVGFSGLDGIVKIVRVSVAFVAEVEPCVRILVRENRIVP